MTTTILHKDLKNGDVVYVQGYRFRVQDIRVSSRKGDKTTLHSEPNRDDVIRYKGVCVDDCSITRTGYNGGTYGAYADVPCTVERN